MSPVVNLGIDLGATFDPRKAIPLSEARALVRESVAPQVLRRWASPHQGVKVAGLRLVLPSVKVGGKVVTMPAWVEAFERMRHRLGAAAARLDADGIA